MHTAETAQIDTKASTGTTVPTKLSALTVIAYIQLATLTALQPLIKLTDAL